MDPGIETTGICILRSGREEILSTVNHRILHLGPIKPGRLKEREDADDILSRCLNISEKVEKYCLRHKVQYLFVEQPPQTIYGGYSMTKKLLITRAQSVFKTFAVAYAIIGRMSDSKIELRTILPVQWQLSKKQRRGLDTKKWSVELANRTLDSLPPGDHPDSIRNHNVADALCMGIITLQKLLDKDSDI